MWVSQDMIEELWLPENCSYFQTRLFNPLWEFFILCGKLVPRIPERDFSWVKRYQVLLWLHLVGWFSVRINVLILIEAVTKKRTLQTVISDINTDKHWKTLVPFPATSFQIHILLDTSLKNDDKWSSLISDMYFIWN